MRNLFWGMLLILIGLFILLDNLGYADFGEILGNYWPLLLVLWGVSLLFRKKREKPPESPQHEEAPQRPESPNTQHVESDLLHQSNVFGDIISKVSSQQFKGGSISTVFGDIRIDLTGTQFAEGYHEMRMHSVFGDSVLSLPKDAAVSIAATSVFGDLTVLGQPKHGFAVDMQTTTPGYSSSSKRMKISISKIFGDVRVE
jgi:predicted membrane protein